MAKVYIVRHSLVQVIPEVEPPKWNLSEEGIALAQQLAESESWEGVVGVFSSTEPKAAQTGAILAEYLGLPVQEAAGLHELEMKPVFYERHEEFKQKVGAYLEGADDPDFEPWESAKQRIVEAVEGLLAEADGCSIVIVSHGRIISALFHHIFGCRVTAAEWKAIGFPDVSVVEWETKRVERGFFAIR